MINLEPIKQAQEDYNKSKNILKELENYDIRKITFNQLHKAQEEYDQNKNIFYDRIAQTIREHPNDWYLNNKFFEIVADIGNRETINNLIYKNNKSIIHNALLTSDIFNHTTIKPNSIHWLIAYHNDKRYPAPLLTITPTTTNKQLEELSLLLEKYIMIVSDYVDQVSQHQEDIVSIPLKHKELELNINYMRTSNYYIENLSDFKDLEEDKKLLTILKIIREKYPYIND